LAPPMKAPMLAFAAMLAGCSSSPTGEDGSCYLPLDRHCSVFSCPSYENSLIELRQFGMGFCFVAQAGRCGDLRFTRRGAGFGDTTQYFDASGAVVAVYATTDAIVMGSACPNWKHYGQRVSCAEVVLENYCRR
jgi:hypothetical protein